MTRDPQVTTLGDPGDPATVLLPRAEGWDPELSRRLVDGSRRVVQYDVDRSPVSILDSLGIEAAHVVAGSETTAQALRLAALHPERVRSLTLIAPVGIVADPAAESAAPIALPTLIVHDIGDEPAARARTIADGIVTSRLLPWNSRDWDLIVPAVLALGVDEDAQRSRYRATAASDPIGWFEHLYAEAESGDAQVPWDYGLPNPLLREWAERDGLDGLDSRGQDAIVVGCALGRDAEFMAEHGFRTTGFDVSETAIRAVRRRFPHSSVSYVAADLLDLPTAWERAYDLVVECITIQALPETLHQKAIANVALLVKPGGRLIVIALRPSADAAADASGPPWPLTRTEIESFEEHGLVPTRIEELSDDGYAGRRDRWRAEFHRPA